MRISDWSSDVCSSDLMLHHLFQSRREDVPGQAQRPVKFPEMLEPDERIADDEQRPPVTDDPEGSGDPALGGSKIGALSLHLCLLLQRYSAPPPCQFAKQTETIPMRGMAPAPPALLAGDRKSTRLNSSH